MDEKNSLNMSSQECINIYDWKGLSCHDRALAIVAENIYKGSSACFILFKMMGRDYLNRTYADSIGDNAYYKFLSKISHIDIIEVLERENNLEKILKQNVDENEKLVLIGNSKYENESSSYRKEDHPHFIVLNGYNRNNFITIDEDYSKKYWKAENSKNGVNYIEKEISVNKLVNICSNIKNFDRYKSCNNNFNYAYYKLSPSNEKFCVKHMMKLYYKQLEDVVRQKEEHRIFCLNILNNYLKKIDTEMYSILYAASQKINYIDDSGATFQEILNQKNNSLISLVLKIPGWFIYPNECQIIGIHHHNIYANYIYWKHTALKSDSQMFITRGLEALISSYDEIQKLVTYSILQKSEEVFISVIHKFERVYLNEIKLYEQFLKLERDCFV